MIWQDDKWPLFFRCLSSCCIIMLWNPFPGIFVHPCWWHMSPNDEYIQHKIMSIIYLLANLQRRQFLCHSRHPDQHSLGQFVSQPMSYTEIPTHRKFLICLCNVESVCKYWLPIIPLDKSIFPSNTQFDVEDHVGEWISCIYGIWICQHTILTPPSC